jgi:hypothetical protein
MSKNKVPDQHGYRYPDLFNNYGTETQCINALLSGNGQMVLFVLLAHQ